MLVKGFSCGARPPHPINIKGHGRLRFIIQLIKYIYLLFVSYLLLPLPNFSNLLLAVLASSPRRLKAF
jgi:hypothetical protein